MTLFLELRNISSMPNTLAHFGIQTLISKTAFRQADIKWIGLGCLIPDVPWILQRIIVPLHCIVPLDPVDLRVYLIIQSSLFFCLLLSAAISLQTDNSKHVFPLLALNCLLHLLLDALQIKWANGSALFAPFSWHLIGFDFFWPEEWPTRLLTLTGLLIFPVAAWRDRRRTMYHVRDRRRQGAGFLLLFIYFTLPLMLFNGPLTADNHYAATLKKYHRLGMDIRLDRQAFRAADRTIQSYSGERFHLTGELPEHNSILSLQGRFIVDNTVLVSRYHVHSPLRDLYSKIGIFMLLIVWLVALYEKRIRINEKVEE